MKVFFQKNSEKEALFKCYINVKKKTFKSAVDRNRIKRRARYAVVELLKAKNRELANQNSKLKDKKKIFVLYEFEKAELKMKFDLFKDKILKQIR